MIYFYGEDSNLTAIFDDKAPDVPAGYGFDYINADGLIHELSVADGRITTKSGMNYRVLALDPYSKHMSLPVLRGIQNWWSKARWWPVRSRPTRRAWQTMRPNSKS